jgi:protein SCO1/2
MKLLPLLAALLVVPTLAAARIDPQSFGQLAFRQHPGAQLPLDADLRDESGRDVKLGILFSGRPVVLVLEYLRCRSLCSLVLRGTVHSLQQARLIPGRDVVLVGVSIDPRDTSADAAKARATYAVGFAEPAAAASGMHFLTGSPQQVARIASVVGFPYRYDRSTDQFAHPAGFVVATPSGQISRYMLGLNPDAGALRDAIAEAGRGAVDPAAHPLLLLCFGYDPDANTAAALALRLARWASLAAVLGCGLLIAFLSLRRRTA